MIPTLCQRWQFCNPIRGNKYIVEVINLVPCPGEDSIEVKIIQVMSTDVPHKNYVGRVFIPTRLNRDGTADDRWSCLNGQDKPEEDWDWEEIEADEEDWASRLHDEDYDDDEEEPEEEYDEEYDEDEDEDEDEDDEDYGF